MINTNIKIVKKEALTIIEIISVMDHIIKTYGVLLPDADFTVIHSGICTLNESVEHIACMRQQ